MDPPIRFPISKRISIAIFEPLRRNVSKLLDSRSFNLVPTYTGSQLYTMHTCDRFVFSWRNLVGGTVALVVLLGGYVLHARLIHVNYGARIAEVVSKLIRKSIAEDRDSESLLLLHPSLSLAPYTLYLGASPRISSRVVFRSQLSGRGAYYGRIEPRKARRRHVGRHLVTFREDGTTRSSLDSRIGCRELS